MMWNCRKNLFLVAGVHSSEHLSIIFDIYLLMEKDFIDIRSAFNQKGLLNAIVCREKRKECYHSNRYDFANNRRT
jgi:hypothetical protein